MFLARETMFECSIINNPNEWVADIEIVMDKYEFYAAGHYLSHWPDYLSYSELMELMKGDSDPDIMECQMYEGIPHDTLAEVIEEMNQALRRIF